MLFSKRGGASPETRKDRPRDDGRPLQNRWAAIGTPVEQKGLFRKPAALSAPLVDVHGEPLDEATLKWAEGLLRGASHWKAGLRPRRARPGPILSTHWFRDDELERAHV